MKGTLRGTFFFGEALGRRMTEVTILMPCLNEAATVGNCVAKARGFLARAQITGEVLVADNGSRDGSRAVAEQAGARVVDVAERGYGAALAGGIAAARGRYVIMGDADDSYDFGRLEGFVARLREGYPLVMGNRFQGSIGKGAMPLLHRYLGNPVLSFVGRLLFRAPVGDFHCGLRGFDRDAVRSLDLRTRGMEFASELVVKAALAGWRIAEVPTALQPDGRGRPSHLRSWRDGWRHLRFLLLFSPRWLFLYPGLALLALGMALTTALYFAPLHFLGAGLDIHSMLYASAGALLGMQLCLFALFARVSAQNSGLLPRRPGLDRLLATLTLERDNIPALLRALDQALEGLDWETIIVVDDAFDGSEDLVRERAQQDRRVRCIHRIGRRGLASACIEGMLASSAPYLAVIDADLQHDETLVPKLLEAAKRDAADIVVASRYMEGGSTGALAAERVRVSRAASALSRVICRGLTDPMSGFFVVRRGFLERVVRRLYGRGFKILLDLVAAARGQVRIVELPYRMRSRERGESKLGARVIAEFFMLLLYHLTGRLLPARFFLFAAVGVTGVGVQLAALSLLFTVSGNFLFSQSVATWAAMTSNFFFNNVFTYGDQRLRGARIWRGMLSFYAACGIGALINIAIAEWLFFKSLPYWAAGLAGALVAALWNFFTTASFTWGGSSAAKR